MRRSIPLLILSLLVSHESFAQPLANHQLERGRRLQERLRRVAAEDIAKSWVSFEPPRFYVGRRQTIYPSAPEGSIYYIFAFPDFEREYYRETFKDPNVEMQYIVEAIRHTRTSPSQRRFWEPYLQRAEESIALALVGQSPSVRSVDETDAYGILVEAVRKDARSLGLEAIPEGDIYYTFAIQVTLRSRNPEAIIYLIPTTSYKIARVLGREPQFRTYASGASARLIGWYFYQLEVGSKRTPLRAIKVDDATAGTLFLP